MIVTYDLLIFSQEYCELIYNTIWDDLMILQVSQT